MGEDEKNTERNVLDFWLMENHMTYANTNEKLYDDIALWEKTDGRDLFLEMSHPLLHQKR